MWNEKVPCKIYAAVENKKESKRYASVIKSDPTDYFRNIGCSAGLLLNKNIVGYISCEGVATI